MVEIIIDSLAQDSSKSSAYTQEIQFCTKQDWGSSIADTLEFPQSCAKPST